MKRDCIVCGDAFEPVRPSVRCCSHACAGAARSNRREDLWRYIQIGEPDECWPWTRWLDRDGYGQFSAGGHAYKAHRLAYELGHGVAPGELKVCHACDNPRCCNPAHLFLGTQTENLRDMIAKGRSSRGSRHHSTELTEEQVSEIRARRSAGERGRVLAAEFGLSEASVSDIHHRRTWGHVA